MRHLLKTHRTMKMYAMLILLGDAGYQSFYAHSSAIINEPLQHLSANSITLCQWCKINCYLKCMTICHALFPRMNITITTHLPLYLTYIIGIVCRNLLYALKHLGGRKRLCLERYGGISYKRIVYGCDGCCIRGTDLAYINCLGHNVNVYRFEHTKLQNLVFTWFIICIFSFWLSMVVYFDWYIVTLHFSHFTYKTLIITQYLHETINTLADNHNIVHTTTCLQTPQQTCWWWGRKRLNLYQRRFDAYRRRDRRHYGHC